MCTIYFDTSILKYTVIICVIYVLDIMQYDPSIEKYVQMFENYQHIGIRYICTTKYHVYDG